MTTSDKTPPPDWMQRAARFIDVTKHREALEVLQARGVAPHNLDQRMVNEIEASIRRDQMRSTVGL